MNAKGEEHEERELKFAGVELGALRERLVELEAERVAGSTFEDNWIFDRAGELEAANQLLRLRVDGQGAQLTFKGPPRFEGSVKRPLASTRLRVLERRGEAPSCSRRSATRWCAATRRSARCGASVASSICLDHTPIGDFVEFEGERGDRVAKRCGFDPTIRPSASSYLMPLRRVSGERTPRRRFDMVFP
jgi:hypothetical protein